uniref:lyase family protein n=1 Tax=Dialister succinatiphilus TaxID=487173 RepID=UPI004038A945
MKKPVLALTLCALISTGSVFAAQPPRDNFYWLGQINKASDVINTDEGLLTPEEGHAFAKGIDKVLRDGNLPGAARPHNVITFEPYLIKAAGPDVTKIHAGRSSQDMLTTVGIMEQREHLLTMAKKLNRVQEDFIRLAEENKDTLIPNYTNGVAAQPNSLAHYFIAYANAYGRDMQRVREYYKRLNRSPMGSTVLNGTGWPLDRDRMAEYLGFDGLAYNTYDAGQIFPQEAPIETGGITNCIAIHTTSFIEEIMQQYAQPRPWIILKEGGGNTYVSSAMPQKRNPGLLNSCRTDASTLLGMSVEAMFRSHNIPAGMADGRLSGARDIMPQASKVLTSMDKILNNLVIDPARSLEELNLDWTCSQEIADELMKNHGIPFRMGHHFASEIVTYARAHDITPRDFTHENAKAIYAKVSVSDPNLPRNFPMTEEEWEHAKDPASIVRNRKVKGGPQPAELDKMIQMAKEELSDNRAWTEETEKKLASAEQKLNQDFDKLL